MATPKQLEAEEAPAAAAAAAHTSFFYAAPAELELDLGRAMSGLTVSPASSPSTPLPPPCPPTTTTTTAPKQDAAASSIPSRMLSNLPSYLLPAFLGGAARGGTFKPLKQHTVRQLAMLLID